MVQSPTKLLHVCLVLQEGQWHSITKSLITIIKVFNHISIINIECRFQQFVEKIYTVEES